MSTLDSIEIDEWTESLDAVLRANGPELPVSYCAIFQSMPRQPVCTAECDYHTFPKHDIAPGRAPMPGDLFMERRIRFRGSLERDGHGHAGQ